MRRTRQQHQTADGRQQTLASREMPLLFFFRSIHWELSGDECTEQLRCALTRPLLFFLAGFYSRQLHAKQTQIHVRYLSKKPRTQKKITQHKYPVHHTHTTRSLHVNEKHGSRSQNPWRAKPPKNTPVSRVPVANIRKRNTTNTRLQTPSRPLSPSSHPSARRRGSASRVPSQECAQHDSADTHTNAVHLDLVPGTQPPPSLGGHEKKRLLTGA